MKVSNNKESLDLANLSRAQKNEKNKHIGKNKIANEAAPANLGDTAEVNISSEAKAISQARQIAKSDNVNQEKIDRIKAMINGGTYKPDFGKVADKMVNEQLLQELS